MILLYYFLVCCRSLTFRRCSFMFDLYYFFTIILTRLSIYRWASTLNHFFYRISSETLRLRRLAFIYWWVRFLSLSSNCSSLCFENFKISFPWWSFNNSWLTNLFLYFFILRNGMQRNRNATHTWFLWRSTIIIV